MGESNHENQLFLSSIRPVVSCTIPDWLKQAGINNDLFKPHATRSASSSEASMGWASLLKILKRGSWSHHSTWQNLCNKNIIQKGHVFQDMLYKDSGKN